METVILQFYPQSHVLVNNDTLQGWKAEMSLGTSNGFLGSSIYPKITQYILILV